jgi:uncharacterized protein (DUF58 family)
MVSISFEELFDPDFMESLHRLRLIAGRVPMGGRFAEQRSKAMGHGIEFRDFRPYTAGDDLRAVDWNIYRRLGRVFLRLFEELEDLPVYLMPDISASGFVDEVPGAPLRAHVGLRTALALGAIAFGQHDSVGLFPISDKLEVAMRPTSGADRVMSFAARLAELSRGGTTDLAAALDQFGAMRMREGLVVLISDFFDPAGIEAVTRAAGRLRHRLLFVQLWRATDAEPDASQLSGDLRLVDSETGAPLDLFIDDEVLARYHAAHANFEDHLTRFAESRRAGLLKLDVADDVVDQLATLFEGGRYNA